MGEPRRRGPRMGGSHPPPPQRRPSTIPEVIIAAEIGWRADVEGAYIHKLFRYWTRRQRRHVRQLTVYLPAAYEADALDDVLRRLEAGRISVHYTPTPFEPYPTPAPPLGDAAGVLAGSGGRRFVDIRGVLLAGRDAWRACHHTAGAGDAAGCGGGSRPGEVIEDTSGGEGEQVREGSPVHATLHHHPGLRVLYLPGSPGALRDEWRRIRTEFAARMAGVAGDLPLGRWLLLLARYTTGMGMAATEPPATRGAASRASRRVGPDGEPVVVQQTVAVGRGASAPDGACGGGSGITHEATSEGGGVEVEDAQEVAMLHAMEPVEGRSGGSSPHERDRGHDQRWPAATRLAVVEGATGSGKTTLVPLAAVLWWRLHHRPVRVAVATPRRLTVQNVYAYVASLPRKQTSLAPREVGMRTGSASVHAADAALLFTTTGSLVKDIVTRGGVRGFTHVFVDEAHVPSAEVDLLVGMLRAAPASNVILMSATAPEWLRGWMGKASCGTTGSGGDKENTLNSGTDPTAGAVGSLKNEGGALMPTTTRTTTTASDAHGPHATPLLSVKVHTRRHPVHLHTLEDISAWVQGAATEDAGARGEPPPTPPVPPLTPRPADGGDVDEQRPAPTSPSAPRLPATQQPERGMPPLERRHVLVTRVLERLLDGHNTRAGDVEGSRSSRGGTGGVGLASTAGEVAPMAGRGADGCRHHRDPFASSSSSSSSSSSPPPPAWRDDTGGGTVLAFLPGIRAIQEVAGGVRRLLVARGRAHAGGGTHLGAAGGSRSPPPLAPPLASPWCPDAVDVIVLHSAHRDGYAAVARPLPPGRVRVILATNTAELGVTLGRVDVLIDTCVEKQKRERVRGVGIAGFGGSSSDLRLVPASLAAITQRAGRVGRCREGWVYRLATAAEIAALPAEPPAELAERAPESFLLDALAFGAKTGVDVVPGLLQAAATRGGGKRVPTAHRSTDSSSRTGSPLATPAPHEASPAYEDLLRRGLSQLVEWGAVVLLPTAAAVRSSAGVHPHNHHRHALSPTGAVLQHLPLDPALARFVLLGARLGHAGICAEAAVAASCGVVRRDCPRALARFAHGSASDLIAGVNALRYFARQQEAMAPGAFDAAFVDAGPSAPAERGCPTPGHVAAAKEVALTALSRPAAEEALLRLCDVHAILDDAAGRGLGCACGDPTPPPQPLTHREMVALSFIWGVAFVEETLVVCPKAVPPTRDPFPRGVVRRYTLRLPRAGAHRTRHAAAAAVGCAVRAFDARAGYLEFERSGGAPYVWTRPYCVWRGAAMGVGDPGVRPAGLKSMFKRAVGAGVECGGGLPAFAPVLLAPADVSDPPDHWPAALRAIRDPLAIVYTGTASTVIPASIPGLLSLVVLAACRFVDPRTAAGVDAADAVAQQATVAVRGTRIEIACAKLVGAWGPQFAARFAAFHATLNTPDVDTTSLTALLDVVCAAGARPDGGHAAFDTPKELWREDVELLDLFRTGEAGV